MQDKRRDFSRNASVRHTCGTCSSCGKEVREPWMLPDEHFYDCSTARNSIGMVEANDEFGCWTE